MDRMKNTIQALIDRAEENDDYASLELIGDILSEFSQTINCPSNWREIGEEIKEKYADNQYVFEALNLWNYDDKENDYEY